MRGLRYRAGNALERFAFHRARRARAKRRSRRTARPRARARNARDAFGSLSGGARAYLDGRTNERDGRALRRRGERVSVLFRDLLRRAKARGDRHCEDGRGGELGVRFRRGVSGKVRKNTRGEPIRGSAAAHGARARHPRALSGGMFPVSWLSAFARDMATPGNTGRKPRRATRATLARCAHTGDKRG